MRHKFLGTGEPGYHPLRKLRTIFLGLLTLYSMSKIWLEGFWKAHPDAADLTGLCRCRVMSPWRC